jgi:predicted N-acetyltransferase YhbS
MLIRRETAADVSAIRSTIGVAFALPEQPNALPPEAALVDELRASNDWLPALSLVAANFGGNVIGHVLCTRGRVDSAPVLALGPLSVHPENQRSGVGSALMHAILGAAEALEDHSSACSVIRAITRALVFVRVRSMGSILQYLDGNRTSRFERSVRTLSWCTALLNIRNRLIGCELRDYAKRRRWFCFSTEVRLTGPLAVAQRPVSPYLFRHCTNDGVC